MGTASLRDTLRSLAQNFLRRDFVATNKRSERQTSKLTWRVLLGKMLNERDQSRLKSAARDLERALYLRLGELQKVAEDQEWARERLDLELARMQLLRIQLEIGETAQDEFDLGRTPGL